MKNGFLAYKKNIFERVKSEFTKVEEYNTKREAEKNQLRYRREGRYFTFYMAEEGKWKLYIG